MAAEYPLCRAAAATTMRIQSVDRLAVINYLR